MSNICSIFPDIIRIEFFRDTPSVISFSKPFVIYDPLITVHDTTVTDSSPSDVEFDCTIKQHPEFEALINELTGTLTVTSSTGLPGTKFKNVVEYDMVHPLMNMSMNEYKSQLVNLQRYNYHLRITYLGGAQQIIRSDESSWAFSFKENKDKISITISIENISGAQRIV